MRRTKGSKSRRRAGLWPPASASASRTCGTSSGRGRRRTGRRSDNLHQANGPRPRRREPVVPTYKVDPFKTTYSVPEDAGGPLVCAGCGESFGFVTTRKRLTGMTAEVTGDFWPEIKDRVASHDSACAGA